MIQKKPAKEKRIEAILDAGLALALSIGLKNTTMEAIAQEAHIAKATLYSYFSDKGEIFANITARLFIQLKEQVENGLAKDISLSDKIALALAAKNKFIFNLFSNSPHREEILSEKSKFASKEVAEFENWLHQQIALTLQEGGHKEPQKYAQIIIACSEGIFQKTQNVNQIEFNTYLVVNKLLN